MRSLLFDATNQEIETAPNSLTAQNPWLLKAHVAGSEFFAKQGSAVAWQGDVSLTYQGAGMKRFLKKAVTGEDLQLMRVAGTGDVFLAHRAENVHVIDLDNDGITANGSNVLAFTSGLEWDLERVKGLTGMFTQGLANVKITGTGQVALTTMGQPIVLDCSQQVTQVDPQAVVAWASSLIPTVTKNESFAKTMIGRGGGESFSMQFSGPGWVIVQPSEGWPVGQPGTG